MIELLLIPAAALINRIRGGGFGADQWPGHARLYAAPLFGVAVGLAAASPVLGLVFGLGFFLWSTLPLNRWDVLGRTPQEKPPEGLEGIIEDFSAFLRFLPWDFQPFVLRETLGVLPVLILASFTAASWAVLLLPIYVAAATGATELAHHLAPGRFRPWSEPLVGSLWGAMALLLISV